MPKSKSVISAFNRPTIDFLVVLGILGAFIFFMGFALLLPAGIDLIYGQDTWYTFVVSAGIALNFPYRFPATAHISNALRRSG